MTQVTKTKVDIAYVGNNYSFPDAAFDAFLQRNYDILDTTYVFSNVSIIKSLCFYGDGEMTGAIFENCTNIGSSAFSYCTKLSFVSFPNCSFIGSGAFMYCKNLSSVYFPTCQYISDSAFYGCSGLTSATFNNCRYVNSYAFFNCGSLSKIKFNNLSNIGACAFSSCTNLSKIYLTSSCICGLYNSYVFTYTGITSSKGSIFVKSNWLSSYKAATNWSYFWSRIFSTQFTPSSCLSLAITASNVSGRATTTTIKYDALCVGLLDGEVDEDDILGTATSAPFPQNTSTTESVQRTISYTYMGKTATTTITQGPWSDKQYTVTVSGISTYGWTKKESLMPLDQDSYDGPYEASTPGFGQASVMRIKFSGYSDFTIWINSYANWSYDYTIASQLDATTYPTNYSQGYNGNGYSATIGANTPGKYSNTARFQYAYGTTLNENAWRKITYHTDSPSSQHTIYISFYVGESPATIRTPGMCVIERNYY